MKNFTFSLSSKLKNHLSLGNGPALNRKRTGNESGRVLSILTLFLMLFTFDVGNVWASVQSGWTRVTTTAEITGGGTFIIGYEATANTDVIVPLRSGEAAATTSANGLLRSGTTSGSTTSGTIDMSSIATTSPYEFTIAASAVTDGAVTIKMSTNNYIGAPGGASSNTAKLYSSATDTHTDYTVSIGANDAVTFTNVYAAANGDNSNPKKYYKYLKYNTDNPRFAHYATTPAKIVLYKKGVSVTHTVTWKVNGTTSSTSDVNEGSKPTFPSTPSSCDGTSTTFIGWTQTPWSGKIDDISGKTTDATKIYTSASAMPNVTADVTYHAVFAKGSPNTFVKGTSGDLTEGQTVLIYNETNDKMMSSSGSSGKLTGITPSFSGTKITTSESAVKWTVEISSTKYKFKQGSNYLWTYGSGNDLYCSSSYQDAWTVEASGSKYYIYYNSSTKLEYYSGFTTYGGTGNIYLMDFYIPEAPTDYLTTCCTELGSINGSFKWSKELEDIESSNSLKSI